MPQPAPVPRHRDDRRRRAGAARPRSSSTPFARRVGHLAAALLLLAGGCASAPVVRWHSLLAAGDAAPAPVGNAVSAAPAGLPAAAWVELTVLRVPVEAEQPQWLVRLPDDTLRLLEEERWAAPLRDELRAALMQGLVARWNVVDARSSRPPEPTTDAIRDALPQPGSPPPAGAAAPAGPANRPATPAAADAAATAPPPELRRVTVDVTRFDSLPDREARLDVVWTIATATGAAAPQLSCRSAFREPVGAGAPALAAGHRRAVAALADVIGRALQAGRGAACPAAAATGTAG